MSKLDADCFLNVDLDIFSKSDLRPVIDALGSTVIEMFVGKVKRTYEAHLELAWVRSQSPTSIILEFCKLIRALPRREQALWNLAKMRSFDIGIEAPAKHRHFWVAVSPEAVDAAAAIGAQIATTVYGPMKPPKNRIQAKKATKSSA